MPISFEGKADAVSLSFVGKKRGDLCEEQIFISSKDSWRSRRSRCSRSRRRRLAKAPFGRSDNSLFGARGAGESVRPLMLRRTTNHGDPQIGRKHAKGKVLSHYACSRSGDREEDAPRASPTT